jgi:hypothetical protein
MRIQNDREEYRGIAERIQREKGELENEISRLKSKNKNIKAECDTDDEENPRPAKRSRTPRSEKRIAFLKVRKELDMSLLRCRGIFLPRHQAMADKHEESAARYAFSTVISRICTKLGGRIRELASY